MARRKRRRVGPTDDWEQLELLCVWPEQREYERIRPLVLFGEPVPERSAETGTPERTLTAGSPPSATGHGKPLRVSPRPSGGCCRPRSEGRSSISRPSTRRSNWRRSPTSAGPSSGADRTAKRSRRCCKNPRSPQAREVLPTPPRDHRRPRTQGGRGSPPRGGMGGQEHRWLPEGGPLDRLPRQEAFRGGRGRRAQGQAGGPAEGRSQGRP